MSIWLWNKYTKLIVIFALLFLTKNLKNDNMQHKYS